jgi:hypothetical protein
MMTSGNILGICGESANTSLEEVEQKDEFGTYRTIGGGVDLNGYWGRLKKLPDNAYVILYHATPRDIAKKIMELGFQADKQRNGGDAGYTYLGGATGLGTYIGTASSDPVVIVARIRKGDLEPDLGADWKSYVRLHRKDAQRCGINVKNPSAVDTYASINQVRARNVTVEALGYLDPEGNTGHSPKTWKFVMKMASANLS